MRFVKVSQFSPVLVAGLMLVACGSGLSSLDEQATAWPTLAPLGSSSTAISNTEVQPQLIERFRVDVTPGVLAIYPFEGHADASIRIEVVILSGSINPQIQINSDAGDSLAAVDLGGENAPEVISEFQFPIDAAYELALGTSSGGGQLGVSIYGLDITRAAQNRDFSSANETLVGVFGTPASFQSFHLPLERGKRVNIEIVSATADLKTRLGLAGPNGEIINADVDESGSNPSIWNFLPSQTGIYSVLVSNQDEGTGSYSLQASPSASGSDAVIGSRAIVNLTAAPRISHWLALDGKALDGIQVEARALAPDLDLAISVSDPFGHLLAHVNSVGVGAKETLDLVQFPFDGQYQIEFSSVSGAGELQYFIRPVRLVDAKIGGRIYPAGRAEHGDVFGPGTVIVYDFQAEAGDLIGVDAHATGGTGLDLGFDLFDPDGERVLTRDDDVGKDPVLDRIKLPKSGWYALTLWNYDSTTGAFEIYVTKPESPATTPN